MNFHLKSDRYEKKKIPLLQGATIVFITFILIQFIFPKLLPSFFIRTVGPIWGVKMVDDRDQKIAELEAKIDSFSLIENEHKLLLQELGLKNPTEVILGRVLSIPPSVTFDTIIINIGEEDGVIKDKIVFVGENIAIGKVEEVYKKNSKIKLYSSPGTEYDVVLGTGTTSMVKAVGRGAGMYEAIVARDLNIQVNDPVTIPGITDTIYARVKAVEPDSSKAFDKILFQSPISIQSLTRVYVEK